MRHVQFQHVEAGLHCVARAPHEVGEHAVHVRARHLARRGADPSR